MDNNLTKQQKDQVLAKGDRMLKWAKDLLAAKKRNFEREYREVLEKREQIKESPPESSEKEITSPK